MALAWWNWTQRVGEAAIDFCFPSLCLFCQQVEPETDGQRFCNSCRSLCQTIAIRQCLRCAAPLGPHVPEDSGCPHCRDERFAFDSASCLGPYKEEMRSACLRAKKASGHALTCDLAEQLWRRHESRLQSSSFEVVIPVPHLWSEQLVRQHLCTLTLAECLASRLHIPVGLDMLRKVKRTAKQAPLSLTARRDNLKGAFAVSRGVQFHDCRILLVDDILTSGSTCHECAKTLKAAGAAEVHVAVIGRAT